MSRTFRWKHWRGAPWNRASMQHVWGDSLVGGWGPFEFIDMCNALNIVPVITLAYDLNSVADWADLVEYTWGDETTKWGRVRIVNDSHPSVYNISIFELGNEQANPHFVAQVTAMEKKRKSPGILAPLLTYLYPTNNGVTRFDVELLSIEEVSPVHIAPDCHVGGGGGIDCATSDFHQFPKFSQSFINCETNAGISTFERAMMEAADLQTWFNFGQKKGEIPSRLIARTASFCTERSGHFDAYDQGIR